MSNVSEDIAQRTPTLTLARSLGRRRIRLGRNTIARLGGVSLSVVIVGVFFSFRTHGDLLAGSNLETILRGLSTIAIMGLGLTTVIIAGEIDLSFAAVYGLSTNLVAVLWIGHGVPVYFAVLVALLAAIVVGVFNAFFTAVIKIPSFIATLGSSTLVYGFTLLIDKSQTLSYEYPPSGHSVSSGDTSFFTNLGNASLGGFPEQGIWALALLVFFAFLLSRTLFGFRLKAIGGSRSAAEIARLPITRYIFLAFIISALMACLAGILDFSFVGTASPDDGQTDLFPVFAAVIIGGASLAGGQGSAIGTVTGALLLAVLSNGFALMASGPFATQILLGTVTVGAVVLDRFTSRRSLR